jgi:hypothetical protein
MFIQYLKIASVSLQKLAAIGKARNPLNENKKKHHNQYITANPYRESCNRK